MKIPVRIRIENEDGTAKTQTDGIYMEKNGTHCIFYSTEDDGACSIRLNAAEVLIRREKGMLPEMRIVLNDERDFYVDTPAGRLALSTRGSEIGMVLSDKNRIFTLTYDLLENGETIQKQNVVITVAGTFVS